MAYSAERWTTVVEMPEYSRRARRLLSEREQEGLIQSLAAMVEILKKRIGRGT